MPTAPVIVLKGSQQRLRYFLEINNASREWELRRGKRNELNLWMPISIQSCSLVYKLVLLKTVLIWIIHWINIYICRNNPQDGRIHAEYDPYYEKQMFRNYPQQIQESGDVYMNIYFLNKLSVLSSNKTMQRENRSLLCFSSTYMEIKEPA